ncbi:MAG: M48 family metallopeptidase [Alphaproteobacteria bacterium]|nr:M48 family metallopeptidase [Alphaproteobacteria bacterium]
MHRIFATRPIRFTLLAASLALAACQTDGSGPGIRLVSENQVQQMAAQSWNQLRQQAPVTDNTSYQRRAERITSRVLRASGRDPGQWEVVVFKDDQLNAFALPGGKIGIYEGMMELASSDAELAAVIGHEIAHNTEKHAVSRVNSQAATQLGITLAAVLVGGEQQRSVAGLLGMGAQYGLLLPHGRSQELEADRLGLIYMARAGYNPEAAVTFWQKMSRQGGSRPPAFLSTHPAPEQRIDQIRAMLPEARQIYRQNS